MAGKVGDGEIREDDRGQRKANDRLLVLAIGAIAKARPEARQRRDQAARHVAPATSFVPNGWTSFSSS